MVGVVGELISSWLTPISLFIFVIATIIISSAVNKHHRHDDDHHHHLAADDHPPLVPPPQLARAPSLFSRVTSFNLRSHSYYPNKEPDRSELEASSSEPVKPSPEPVASLLSRVSSFRISGLRNPEYKSRGQEEERENRREEVIKKELAPVKQRKGKPPVVRREKAPVRWEADAAEVDAKADDFINKFKQQLKLQRLESLLRYRNNPTSAT